MGKVSEHRLVLGRAIRHYRKQRGLTQESLAELADLNPKYIGEVERREKTISVDALARIAQAVKMPLAEFFREIPEDQLTKEKALRTKPQRKNPGRGQLK